MRLWILGADSAEMRGAERLLRSAGERFAYATFGDREERVSLETAHRADGVSRYVGESHEVYLVDCGGETLESWINAARIMARIDSKKADTPEGFLPSSVIGQIVSRLAILREPLYEWSVSDGRGPVDLKKEGKDPPPAGEIEFAPSNVVYMGAKMRPCWQVWSRGIPLRIPYEFILAAAASFRDDALAGLCPGVGPAADLPREPDETDLVWTDGDILRCPRCGNTEGNYLGSIGMWDKEAHFCAKCGRIGSACGHVVAGANGEWIHIPESPDGMRGGRVLSGPTMTRFEVTGWEGDRLEVIKPQPEPKSPVMFRFRANLRVWTGGGWSLHPHDIVVRENFEIERIDLETVSGVTHIPRFQKIEVDVCKRILEECLKDSQLNPEIAEEIRKILGKMRD